MTDNLRLAEGENLQAQIVGFVERLRDDGIESVSLGFLERLAYTEVRGLLDRLAALERAHEAAERWAEAVSENGPHDYNTTQALMAWDKTRAALAAAEKEAK